MYISRDISLDFFLKAPVLVSHFTRVLQLTRFFVVDIFQKVVYEIFLKTMHFLIVYNVIFIIIFPRSTLSIQVCRCFYYLEICCHTNLISSNMDARTEKCTANICIFALNIDMFVTSIKCLR